MRQNYNKKNKGLALLGHSKLKAILPFTLLMIGLLVGMNGAFAQDQIPEALKLDKKFYPDDPMGHSGKLWLETYTTGTVTQVHTSLPTDIVLVLDASSSMNLNSDMPYGSGNITRLEALQRAVRDFIDQIEADAVANTCDHRIAVVSFSTAANTRLLSTGTVRTGNVTSFTTAYYQDALVSVRDYINTDRLGSGLTGGPTNWGTGRINAAVANGTHMPSGLQAAREIFNARTTKTFTVPGTSTTLPRNMVVVFFTDGYPNDGSSYFTDLNFWPRNTNANGAIVGLANNAVLQSSYIKELSVTSGGETVRPTIYSIGVANGANPATNYTVQRGETNGQPSNNGNYWVTGTKCFNALLHFISNDYSPAYNNTVTNWETPAPQEANGGSLNPVQVGINRGFYKAASSASELSEIFRAIASSSGGTPITLGSTAVVQDVISSSFRLPEGASVNDIKVYAPMLKRGRDGVATQGMKRKNADSPWEYCFMDTITGSTNSDPDHPDYLGRLVLNTTTGHITDTTYENRLDSQDVVTIDPSDPTGKTISFTHFDFSHYYCGPVVEGGDTTGYVGRKLVMIIPIVIEEGTWGDGIETNGELSFVTPEGTTHWQFPIPGATVVGDVWTEIITKQPAGYADDDINSPEDLAWFISRVNGRAGYLNDNNVASSPTLSGKLTADIDMSAHNWVPIGAGYKCNAQGQYVDANNNPVYDIDPVTNEPRLDINGNPITLPTVNLAYEGVFDGNGHVVTGLKNNATKYYKLAHAEDYQVLVYPGMFSNVKGNGTNSGVVKNVFVLSSDFRARNHERDMETFKHFGIIADTLTGGAIYNCEAAGSINCNNDYENQTTHEIDYTQMGRDSEMIVGGLVGLNNGGTIHSSMAMAELTGYSMGGMVGEMRNGAILANGFTNGVFNYLGTRDGFTWNTTSDPQGLFRYVGGLVGNQQAGTVKNCYVRFERDNSFGTSAVTNSIKFGQFIGMGSGTVEKCYYPRGNGHDLVANNGTLSNCNFYSAPTDPTLIRYERSNDNMVGGTWEQHTLSGAQVDVCTGGTTLVDVLNGNLVDGDGYARWKRTTAGNYSSSHNGGNINGDLPVLKFTDYTTVASTNGIALDYAKSLDEMLSRHNTGNLNVNTALPYAEELGYHGMTSHNYHVSQTVNKSQSDLLYGATINLYANDNTSMSTMSITNDGKTISTLVYIDENISLLQEEGSSITAFTGQHIIDYGANSNIQSGNRWHNVSSSLDNSKFGWGYDIEDEVPFSWTETNPCGIRFESSDGDVALFPIDMRAQGHPSDFYCFDEPSYHWINFRRNSLSHWHMDYEGEDIPANHNHITYNNEDHFIRGKGYLLALHTEYFGDDQHLWNESENAKKDRTYLQNRGVLNNGEFTIPVYYTADNEWTGLAGYNLLGNPYQSYLDFDEFVTENASLWGDEPYARTYAVIVPEIGKNTYLQYTPGASGDAAAAGQYLNMHQGFFIRVSQADENTVATFTNDMRTNEPTAGTHLRGGQVNYPLVNLFLTDSDNNTDVAVLEVGRPENGGGEKLRVGSATGRISLRYDDTDFGILFRDMTEGSQPLRFETQEDGTFTLSWNTANANFSSLTLVDNITGVNYDMLAHDSYEFEGRASDYKSRFKILIGEFTDVEENEDPSTSSGTFAFYDGSEWIVNGKGQLTVTDVMGRMVYTDNLTNDQNHVSLNGLSQGVYLMQVRNGNGAMVQKIVVR